MQTVTEIQAKLAELVAAMVEKGVVTPDVDLTLKADRHFVYMTGSKKGPLIGATGCKFFNGDTPEDAITAAVEYIAALPSIEETVTRTYLRKVADAVDYAKENGVDDEYVTPLRGVTCAMTSNLIEKGPM